MSARPQHAPARHHVEDLARPHAPRFKIHELAARPLHELVKLVLLDLERRAAFVTPAERHPEAAAGMIVARAECRDVALIVIGYEPGPVGNLEDFVFQEQSSRHRAEIDDAGVRVAEVAGRTSAARQIEPHVDPFGLPTRDRIGNEERRAEEHVRIAHAFNAAAPVRHVDARGPRERLVDADFACPLPFGLQIFASACFVVV